MTRAPRQDRGMAGDPFDLDRFVQAQEGVWPTALAEVRAGRKASHWMWFVFPQVAGLGTSPMARRFAVSGLAEAAAYLAHPLLGARLVDGVRAALAAEGRSAHEIFGSPDDVKFRSCLTLFGRVPGAPGVFREGLERFFGGREDAATVERLRG
jgi:uncharacterized protein (DUF1810 family)